MRVVQRRDSRSKICLSDINKDPYIKMNRATIPENLLESDLFGMNREL
ncbi:sigma 54-interacting transcriptional regulator [Desulfosporosinus sp. BICA1-9]